MTKQGPKRGGRQSRFSTIFMKQVMREIILHNWSYRQAAVHFGLRGGMISGWYRKYAEEVASVSPPAPQDLPDLENRDKRIEELEQALFKANLQVTSLEILIETAEKNYPSTSEKSLVPNRRNYESTLCICRPGHLVRAVW